MFSRWLFRVPGIHQVYGKLEVMVFWARGSHLRAAFLQFCSGESFGFPKMQRLLTCGDMLAAGSLPVACDQE